MFAHPAIEEARFGAISEELSLREAARTDPELFALLASVHDLVAVFVPDASRGTRAGLFGAHARLVYHAFHYWAAGKPGYALSEAAVRGLVGAGSIGTAPGPAGWAGLPSTLLWARLEPSATPEPVNGFFWAAPAGELQVLLVTGMRPDRGGFGTLDARAEFGADGFAEDFEPRPGDGPAFGNILPGGELDGLLSVVTRGEALTLAARALAVLEPA
ncbi:MAG: hypothetical protein ABFS34_11060 [Gemmatimonadota bacterium]